MERPEYPTQLRVAAPGRSLTARFRFRHRHTSGERINMYSQLYEWLTILIFFVCFTGLTFGEASWLNRRKWDTYGRSLAFSAATNIFSFGIGFFVLFVVFFIVLALAWDGTLNKVPGRDNTAVAALVLAALLPFVLLTLSKVLLLALMKMKKGKPAWLFSAASAAALLIVSTGLPVAFIYLISFLS
jgi:hypothetical protein